MKGATLDGLKDRPLNIRGIDRTIWREVRARAVKRNVPMGTLLNQILQQWLESEKSS